MPKVPVRMYQRLWEKIRDSANGTIIVVFAPEALHRRIIKALRNERARDKSFSNREDKLLHLARRDTASITACWKEQPGIEASRAMAQNIPLFEYYNEKGDKA